MLGSVLVGLSAGKIIENAVKCVSTGPVNSILIWSGLFAVFVLLFVYWERVQRTVEETAEKATEE